MEAKLKAEIKTAVKQAIKKFFKTKENKELKTFHILDILFTKERRIRSLIGGLETSLGIVWEAIAKILARSNDFEIVEKKLLRPDPFPPKLQKELDQLITLREGNSFISTQECINRLKNSVRESNLDNLNFSKPPSGTGVDIYLLKNNIEYAFDVKATQPNMGDFKRFNKQLLEWYSYRFAENPDADFFARIAVPFNPYKKNWYEQKKAGIEQCLDKSTDICICNEFWDFCSGEKNTWEEIIQIFQELHQEGFNKEFDDIFEGKN